MQRKTTAALRKVAPTTLAVILLLALLPGCAVVGPLLSVGSFIGAAPLQYASAVYTVGEYSYEYAAHDKDPSEVVEGKIMAVLDGSAFRLDGFAGDDSKDETMVADGSKVDALRTTLAERSAETRLASDGAVEATISADARKQRIDRLLGHRDLQFERLELRRMAFLKARSGGELSLRQTAMASSPDLFMGAGKTTLRQ